MKWTLGGQIVIALDNFIQNLDLTAFNDAVICNGNW